MLLSINANSKLSDIAFIVRKISKKKGQNEREYYSLRISRGIKTYDGKIWSCDEKYLSINPGDIVKVSGNAKTFKGSIQIHIDDINVIEESEELIGELMPFCHKSENKLREEIETIIETIKNKNIIRLLENIYNIPEVKENFYKKSAGVEIHHAYVRGLAQHSLEVAQNVITYCNMGYSINYDIAVATALIHDIGKIYELSNFPENAYTDEGKLLGHISIGANLVKKCIDEIEGFPKSMELDILHVILSHHGNKEMGSPVVPMTIEAIAVHNADKASAEINSFHLTIQRDNTLNNWTEYNTIYKRSIKK